MTEHLMVALQSQHDLVSVIQALTENIPFGEADCEAVWRSARRNLPYKNTVDDATVPTAAYRVVVDDGPTRIDSQSGAYELDSQSGAHELLLLLALVSRVRLVLIRSLQTGQEVTRFRRDQYPKTSATLQAVFPCSHSELTELPLGAVHGDWIRPVIAVSDTDPRGAPWRQGADQQS